MKKLLLTAFEPFGGETINPSLEVARAIERLRVPAAEVAVVELPVARFEATRIVLDRLRIAKPDVVVMLGEAGGRSGITPERLAVNMDDFPIPDNAGHQPRGEPIVEGGPAEYVSTLPIATIVSQLEAAQIPAGISHSAGRYLCNRVFYSVMHWIAVEQSSIPAGFIHLPYLHEQTAGKGRHCPSMSRETMTQGVRIAIEASLRASDVEPTRQQGHQSFVARRRAGWSY